MSTMESLSREQCLELFQENLYQLGQTETVPTDCIARSLKTAGFCFIRGLITPAEVMEARRLFQSRFSRSDDRPSVGESPRDIQRNFQKLRVGISPVKPLNSRLVRTIYNPMWEEDVFGMHKLFRRMISLRNTLMEMPDDFASTTPESGLWTAARLQHYPRGGGFMNAHRDELIIDAVSDAGLTHFQVMLLMSKKGVDFARGGGFTIRDGFFVDTEQFCELGDIVIYDPGSLHGVDTIDPQETLDLESPAGRLVAFATLYQDLGQ